MNIRDKGDVPIKQLNAIDKEKRDAELRILGWQHIGAVRLMTREKQRQNDGQCIITGVSIDEPLEITNIHLVEDNMHQILEVLNYDTP